MTKAVRFVLRKPPSVDPLPVSRRLLKIVRTGGARMKFEAMGMAGVVTPMNQLNGSREVIAPKHLTVTATGA